MPEFIGDSIICVVTNNRRYCNFDGGDCALNCPRTSAIMKKLKMRSVTFDCEKIVTEKTDLYFLNKSLVKIIFHLENFWKV